MNLINLIIGIFIITYWAVLSVLTRRVKRVLPELSPGTPESGFSKETVTVLVPARNESRDLKRSIQSLLNQTFSNLKIIIINDHSSDATAQIADELAKQNPSIAVIHNPPLQPGWFGKVNALQAAFIHSSSTFVLLTDADIFHEPTVIRQAMSVIHEKKLDGISLFPKLVVKPFWEHVILPMYMTGFAKFFSHPEIADPDSHQAAGAGAFFLIRRSALESSGGFYPIRSAMADDAALADQLAAHGSRMMFMLAPQLLHVEMFKSNSDAFWNTQKNILMAIHKKEWLALPLICITLILFGGPFWIMASSVFSHQFTWLIAGISLYLFQYAGLFTLKPLVQFNPLKMLAFPLVAVSASINLFIAYKNFLRNGIITWRGRQLNSR